MAVPPQLKEHIRTRRPQVQEEAQVYKRRSLSVWTDQASAVDALCSDLGSALAAEIEEVQAYHSEFRTALRRAFTSILSRGARSPEPVVIFDEAVPGYTLLLFKKSPAPPPRAKTRPSRTPQVSTEDISVERRAASRIIDCYVKRTGNRVLVVEAEDAIFVFFPVSDMKKNLRAMGYTGFRD